MELMFALLFVTAAFALLSVGVIIRQKPFKGSCGGANQLATLDGFPDGVCEFCGATPDEVCKAEEA